jgi:ankyrin repeat protein
LLATQQSDGGWSQITTRRSDAYATGEALVALNQTGMSTQSPPYRRGVAFLVRTQGAEGSWHVQTRRKDEAAKGQEYFESGFPHGRDQFISFAASAWATMALSLTRSSGASPALTDTAPRTDGLEPDAGAWTAGTTPLMQAALFGTLPAMRALLDGGADANAANVEGTTALMWAATRGVAMVQLLLERGANVNAADSSGSTPLMLAAGHSGRVDVMHALIGAGADVNTMTNNQWSALRYAVKSGDRAAVRLLLDRGATLLISPRNTNRMMMIAATQGDTAMLELLLDRGLDVNHAVAGYTALMAAASSGVEPLLGMLLRRGADPNRVEAQGGLTALMYAMLDDPGHDRMVRALVAAGARPEVRSSAGLTAADYAVKYGHSHLLAALPK